MADSLSFYEQPETPLWLVMLPHQPSCPDKQSTSCHERSNPSQTGISTHQSDSTPARARFLRSRMTSSLCEQGFSYSRITNSLLAQDFAYSRMSRPLPDQGFSYSSVHHRLRKQGFSYSRVTGSLLLQGFHYSRVSRPLPEQGQNHSRASFSLKKLERHHVGVTLGSADPVAESIRKGKISPQSRHAPRFGVASNLSWDPIILVFDEYVPALHAKQLWESKSHPWDSYRVVAFAFRRFFEQFPMLCSRDPHRKADEDRIPT
jgi:hypothetical protein